MHGRSQRLIESNWICYEQSPANAQTGERLLQHAAGSCMQPAPNPSTTGVWNAGQFQLEVFARGNNANHWAGEVDVFESTAAVQRSDYSMPTLGDIAVLEAKPGSHSFEVPFAGFFDETWGRIVAFMDH